MAFTNLDSYISNCILSSAACWSMHKMLPSALDLIKMNFLSDCPTRMQFCNSNGVNARVPPYKEEDDDPCGITAWSFLNIVSCVDAVRVVVGGGNCGGDVGRIEGTCFFWWCGEEVKEEVVVVGVEVVVAVVVEEVVEDKEANETI